MTNDLSGIKVIETASVLAGPLAGRLLGDLGANVIHIDRPDNPRGGNPFLLQGGRLIPSDINYVEENTNCNKRSMILDITNKKGLCVLYRLLESADVFLTNFRPYELKKFNLEYESLSRINPRLIQANLTAWGKKGPDKDLPGYDFNTFWTRSGIMRVLMTPDMEPISTPAGLGDRVTALALAYGITSALLIRERTGLGQEIDTSLLQAAIFINANDIGGTLVTGKDRQSAARSEIANVLLNSYKTKDGRWLRIAINKPVRDWPKFCLAIGQTDLETDPRFETIELRFENRSELFNILETVFSTRTLAEWKVALTEARLPWGPILNLPEVVADVQVTNNDAFQSYKHPIYGQISIVDNPINFGRTSTTVRRPAPSSNEHTDEILREHGYSTEEISNFREQGIIVT